MQVKHKNIHLHGQIILIFKKAISHTIGLFYEQVSQILLFAIDLYRWYAHWEARTGLLFLLVDELEEPGYRTRDDPQRVNGFVRSYHGIRLACKGIEGDIDDSQCWVWNQRCLDQDQAQKHESPIDFIHSSRPRSRPRQGQVEIKTSLVHNTAWLPGLYSRPGLVTVFPWSCWAWDYILAIHL